MDRNYFGAINCDFFGCEELWNGIYVDANAAIYCLNSTFKSAESAINFIAGFSNASEIAGCTFENNYVGINIGKKTDSPIYFYPSLFGFNTFISDGNDLLEPRDDEKAFCGIRMINCAGGLIGYAGTGNRYESLRVGIYMQDANVMIQGDTFSSMLNGLCGNPSSCKLGNGIYAKGCNLKVEDCTFSYDYLNGIRSQEAKSLTVLNCIFTGEGDFGIYTSENDKYPGALLQIDDNDFNLNLGNINQTELGAISFERVPGANSFGGLNQIRKNRIEVPSGSKYRPMTLIDITTPFGGQDVFSINDNYLNVATNANPVHGVYITGSSSNIHVTHNRLSYTNNVAPNPLNYSSSLGMSLVSINNSFGNRLSQNSVNAVYFPAQSREQNSSQVKCGFHIDDTPDVQMCGDTLNGNYRGAHLSGNLFYCDFTRNIIGDNFYGIHCRKQDASGNTMLGNQNWHENEWIGDYERFGAYFDTTDGVPNSIFRVDVGLQANFMPFTRFPANGWFIPATTGAENSDCIEQSEPPHGLNDIELKIISEEQSFDTPVLEWDAIRELMLKLMRFPALVTSAAIDTFYNHNINTSAGKFAWAEHLYYEAFVMPGTIEVDIQDYQNELSEWMDSLGYLSILQAADDSDVDLLIASDQTAASVEIQRIIDSLEILYRNANSVLQDNFDDVDTWIQGLPSTESYESSLKTIFMLTLKKAYCDSLTASDYSDLETIIAGCPNTDGKSIRLALSLMPKQEAIAYHQEDIWEACMIEERSNKTTFSDFSKIRIIPNPAQEFTSVWLPENFGAGFWNLISLEGAIRKSGKITEGVQVFKVNLTDVAPGIYQLILRSSAGAQFVEKVVVNR